MWKRLETFVGVYPKSKTPQEAIHGGANGLSHDTWEEMFKMVERKRK